MTRWSVRAALSGFFAAGTLAVHGCAPDAPNAPGRETGTVVSSAGDVDGDGLDDLFISAPRSSEVETNSGKVYLLLSRLRP